jgi:hypothetical protein
MITRTCPCERHETFDVNSEASRKIYFLNSCRARYLYHKDATYLAQDKERKRQQNAEQYQRTRVEAITIQAKCPTCDTIHEIQWPGNPPIVMPRVYCPLHIINRKRSERGIQII